MSGADEPASLNPTKNGIITELFVHLQICKEFGINPLEYFVDKNAEWKNYLHLKILLIAFRQLVAEEENRQLEEIKKKNNNDNK